MSVIPTDRDLEVLECQAYGWTYVQIAHELGMSVTTVRMHVQSIHRRLGAYTAAQAVAIMDDRQPGWRRRLA